MPKQTQETAESGEKAAAPLNIYQRLNEVRKKVSYLKKDKSVQGQYKAVTHDQVTGWVREHLVENGVFVIASLIVEHVADTNTTTSKGVPIIRLETRFQVRFVNMDDPGDHFAIEVSAHALDQGDKAPGKAMSYAVKYALLKVLNIETGEDDESRIQTKVAETDPAIVAKMEAAKSVADLAKVWKSLTPKQCLAHAAEKDRIKAELQNPAEGDDDATGN